MPKPTPATRYVYVLTCGSPRQPRGYVGTYATREEATEARRRERQPCFIKRERRARETL
jgi:hypothetical protein